MNCGYLKKIYTCVCPNSQGYLKKNSPCVPVVSLNNTTHTGVKSFKVDLVALGWLGGPNEPEPTFGQNIDTIRRVRYSSLPWVPMGRTGRMIRYVKGDIDSGNFEEER
jgi:hypothetical protein